MFMHIRCFVAQALVLLVHTARTQSIAPDATTSAGGHGTSSSAMLSWSLGQVCGASLTGGTHVVTAGVQQPEVPWVRLSVRVFLGGPFTVATTLMSDGLRSLSLLPTTEPYTAAGFAQHVRVRSVALHGADIERVGKFAKTIAVGINDGDVVGLAGEARRE